MKKNIIRILLISILILSILGITLICIDTLKKDTPPKANFEKSILDESTLLEKIDGKTILELDAKTNLYIANNVMNNLKYYESELTGDAKTKVLGINTLQKTLSRKTLNDDVLFIESLSYSKFVKLAYETYFKDNSILERKGTLYSINEDANYSKSKIKSYKQSEYISKYGYVPDSVLPYVLNDSTILEAKLLSSENNQYTFSYKLDPKESVKYYAYKVMTMGDTSELPIFSSVEITVTMNADYKILKIETAEIYQLKGMVIMGINLEPTINSTTVEIFKINENVVPIKHEQVFLNYMIK